MVVGSAELMSAGFTSVQAMKIVEEVRRKVDPQTDTLPQDKKEEIHAV